MERVFSVEEIPNTFWAPSPPPQQQPIQPQVVGDGGVAGGGAMDQDQAAKEWSFERLLEETLFENSDAAVADPSDEALYATNSMLVAGEGRCGGYSAEAEVEHANVAPTPVLDPMEYNTVLKRKLEEDLATIAMWRASGATYLESSRASNNYIGGSSGIQVQNNFDGGPGHLVQNADIRGKQAVSFSSREPSPTDDDYGEVEILGFMIPNAEKVRKRKESNRESARRSRNRKAAHMKELEDQVAHLRVENSSLLRRLAALNQKYNDATVDKRVLIADIETLRAKVKMAEDTVQRVTSTISLLPRPVNGMPPLSMPFGVSPSSGTTNAPAPMQDYFACATDVAGVNSNYMLANAASPSFQAGNTANGSLTARKMNRIASQRAMAQEHLQKRLRGGAPTSSGSAPLGPNELANMEMH